MFASSLFISDSTSDWLDNLLKEKLSKNDENQNFDDVRWAYVQKSLDLLFQFKQLSETENDILVSVTNQQNLASLVQLVIALGALPSLLPGVGLSMSKRSKFYEVVAKKDQNLSVLDLHDRLVLVTKKLLELNKDKNLNQIILTKNLGDILASLIQLSSAPLKKPSENEVKKDENEFVMTSEKYKELLEEQEIFKQELSRIVDNVYAPLLVKYLLVLQSCGATQAVKPLPKSLNVKKLATPKWVQSACGALLTQCLIQSKNGVLNVIQGILDVGDDQSKDVQRYVKYIKTSKASKSERVEKFLASRKTSWLLLQIQRN